MIIILIIIILLLLIIVIIIIIYDMHMCMFMSMSAYMGISMCTSVRIRLHDACITVRCTLDASEIKISIIFSLLGSSRG